MGWESSGSYGTRPQEFQHDLLVVSRVHPVTGYVVRGTEFTAISTQQTDLAIRECSSSVVPEPRTHPRWTARYQDC